MLCRIADLLIEVPEAGGMAPRCKEYLSDEMVGADIVIRADLYKAEKYPTLDENGVAYMESCKQFCSQLLNFGGFYLHSSAVCMDGRAFLFSGPSGMGKSTHTRLWQQIHGEAAQVFNDDKPALRRIDGSWYAYGTPWCGKDGINQNMKVPLAGICFLRRGQENVIRRMEPLEATTRILSQTIRRFRSAERLDLLLGLVDQLVREIPVYEFFNRPEPEAAWISYNTMNRGAEDMGR